jgi:glycosyltransferase involved in cell wall biosynthesis
METALETPPARDQVTTYRRLRVMAVAFACCPPGGVRFSGGEDVLGWNLIGQISRFHDTWVLTDAWNRSDIERSQHAFSDRTVYFTYVALPRWLRPLTRLQGGLQFYCYLWQVQAFFVAKRLARQFDFDLVHHLTYANDWMASFIGALLPLAYLRGPGGGAHRVPRAFLREFGVMGRLAEHLRGILQWLLRHDPFFIKGQQRALRILVCNKEAFDGLAASWRPKALLFPVNGISSHDFALLHDSPPATPLKAFRVLSAGKLIRLKGFSLAIKAFHRFHERHPAATLEIIGDGPDRPYLEALIRARGLEDKVRLSRWQPRDAFLDALRACDVFLFASLRDGGGAVVVEAMAAGKPVVCLQLGGPGLHVTAECGIAVSARTPAQATEDLAEALGRCYRGTALRHRMGQAGRQRAEAIYHWDRLGERLARIYDEVLQPSRAERVTRL